MKLIDILVEELPKLGGWPEDVGAITQDSDRSINNYRTADGLETNEHGKWRYSSAWQCYLLSYDDVSFLADDYTTAIITREKYEAALAEKEHPLPWDEKNKPCPTLGAECRGCPDCGRRVSCTSDDITDDAVRAEMGMNSRSLDAALAAKNDGWIEWGGGRCPVDDVTEVDIKFRTGGIAYGVEAGKYYWPRTGQEYDIIAYRLHQPQEAVQVKPDEEADLNECIGQDAAPVWNGEGLPPVGCECQYRKHKKSEQSEWFNGVVKYTSEFTVVIQPVCYPGETVGHPANFEFRPTRSAEDEKRDDRASAIDGFISGFRGQETGSNKELAYALTDYLALLDKL